MVIGIIIPAAYFPISLFEISFPVTQDAKNTAHPMKAVLIRQY